MKMSYPMWWDDHEGMIGVDTEGSRRSIDIETEEPLPNPIGFVRLRERHRVKAISVRRK